MLLNDLKLYLARNGYENIFLDELPDMPHEAMGLFVWANTAPTFTDGTATRYIQVQVRDTDWEAAYLRACALSKLLDSGSTEEKIFLTPERWCICRPRSLPKKLRVDQSTRPRTTYYFEFSLWGDNEP